MKKTITFWVLLFSWAGFAQSIGDSIQKLETVQLSDAKLKKYKSGLKIQTLKDSVIQKNGASLTSLLRFNTGIHLKENGAGMVSSPAFRGTNASQTAVIWNGVNINSKLNGQADFNTLFTPNYSEVIIRSGGGSVQYGSGAVGGSVHLNSKLQFNTHFKNEFQLTYGSFDTKQWVVNSSLGSPKATANLGVFYKTSKNDYDYIGTDLKNENGELKLLNLNFNAGYVISKRSVLKLYHQQFHGDRNLSGTLVSPSLNKLKDQNFRNMLDWHITFNTFNSSLKAVYLKEAFKFFENKNSPQFSDGKVDTYLLKHSFNGRISKTIHWHTILEYNYNKGKGSSFGNPTRQGFTITGLWKHKLSKRLNYGVQIQKGFNSEYEIPVVYSSNLGYTVSDRYKISFNGSKNFRVPTFNDLFWQGSGQRNLKPESSYQLDLGNTFRFNNGGFNLHAFYINSSDLIVWQPDSSGLWRPINISEAENYGLESSGYYKFNLKKHNIHFNSNYAYTIATDKNTNKQRIFVPKHKLTLGASYYYNRISAFYQQVYTSEVNKIGGTLRGYLVANLGFGYRLTKQSKVTTDLQFTINNLYNTYYETVAVRPMPNRHFNLQLTLKI